jgi:acetylornithine deacetylase
VEQYLQAYGLSSQLTLNDDGSKANLFARIGAADLPVLLSGHTDVVPVDGQAWTRRRSP